MTGIEAVNEPQANGDPAVKKLVQRYYPWAHSAIAHPAGSKEASNLTLVAHDGFMGLGAWQDFWTGTMRDRVREMFSATAFISLFIFSCR